MQPYRTHEPRRKDQRRPHMDRSSLNRALAKTLAYIGCGKLADASAWAQQLVDALRAAGLTIR
uniref:Uncharacterized protein n=1 Tax=viral metagenome TaxID=1070528 RepID=A0A6M3L4C3_9ZZZZ